MSNLSTKGLIKSTIAAPVHEALVRASRRTPRSSPSGPRTTTWNGQRAAADGGAPPGGDDADQQQDPDRAKEMQERMLDRAKQNTSLKLKSRSVTPERVESIDSPGGRTLVFLFPRTANILAGL